MREGGRDEEVASSKRKTELKTKVQKSIPFLWPNGGKMAKIDTQFMIKTGWKTIPFVAAHTYIAHIICQSRLHSVNEYWSHLSFPSVFNTTQLMCSQKHTLTNTTLCKDQMKIMLWIIRISIILLLILFQLHQDIRYSRQPRNKQINKHTVTLLHCK